MTQTDFESYLSFVSLADDGYAILLNGKKKYSARLPKGLSRKKAHEKQKIVVTTIFKACNS